MKQPKILLNGKEYDVVSLWWHGCELRSITYLVGEKVDSVFGTPEKLESLFVK